MKISVLSNKKAPGMGLSVRGYTGFISYDRLACAIGKYKYEHMRFVHELCQNDPGPRSNLNIPLSAPPDRIFF